MKGSNAAAPTGKPGAPVPPQKPNKAFNGQTTVAWNTADSDTSKDTHSTHGKEPSGVCPNDPHPGETAPMKDIIQWYFRNANANRIPQNVGWDQLKKGHV